MGSRDASEVEGTSTERVVRLRDVGELFSGLVLARVHGEGAGATSRPVVSLRDVDDEVASASDLGGLMLTASQASRYRLALGDVVVTSRTSVIRAAVVREQHAKAGCVLGANLFAVRLRPGTLSPELLAAYVKVPAVQASLLGRRRGTAVPGMTTADLGDLRLAIPPVERQDALRGVLELSAEHRRAVMRGVELRSDACSELVSLALSPRGREAAP